tara:strand:+ start:178 stop:429 length:252 start_codon:yes stop_codon:yes gene_type:complete
MDPEISKIDTQGLSGPALDPEKAAKGFKYKDGYPPMMVKPRRLLEDTFVKEMKILINEVLDEREGKMDYQSYFDLTGREYPVV